MPQSDITCVNISIEAKSELESRKKSLKKRIGRAVSFDEVIRTLLGWRI